MESSSRKDGSFSDPYEQSHKKCMEDTRGKYSDTMDFHLKTQLRVEICIFFFTLLPVQESSSCFCRKRVINAMKCLEGMTVSICSV